MTRFQIIFSTRTLLQIVTVLTATLLMKLAAEGYDLSLMAAFSN